MDYASFHQNIVFNFGKGGTANVIASAVSLPGMFCSDHSSPNLNEIQVTTFQEATNFL